jgi:hypothetical protein
MLPPLANAARNIPCLACAALYVAASRKQWRCLQIATTFLGTTTADTIAESNETFTIVSGTASATGTINDDAAQLWQRSLLLRLLKEVLLCLNSA